MAKTRDLWVFAYGSLMWRPGFPYAQAAHARLVGWRRSFCIYSRYHRGSMRRPGLVLGLDRGGMCEGMAFRVLGEDAAATLEYLREREQIISVYREALVPVTLLTGERPEVMALAFLVERAHPSYSGELSLCEQAHLIRGARGRSGSNIEYLMSTLAHLKELGIRERAMERLLGMVGANVLHGDHGARCSGRTPQLLEGVRTRPVRVRPLRPEDAQRFAYRTVLGVR